MAKRRKKIASCDHHNNAITSMDSSSKRLILWGRHPFISQDEFFGIINKSGRVITNLLFVALLIFFYRGYTIRPRILNDDLIQRITHPPQKSMGQVFHLGPASSKQKVRFEKDKEGIRFNMIPDESVGFYISTDFFKILPGAKNLGLTTCSQYKGSPTITYGFTDIPPDKTINITSTFSVQMTPRINTEAYMVSIPSKYYKPGKFEVPWDRAKYFYFYFTSPSPMELILEKLIFIENK